MQEQEMTRRRRPIENKPMVSMPCVQCGKEFSQPKTYWGVYPRKRCFECAPKTRVQPCAVCGVLITRHGTHPQAKKWYCGPACKDVAGIKRILTANDVGGGKSGAQLLAEESSHSPYWVVKRARHTTGR